MPGSARVLIPDAQFEGGPEVEQQVLGAAVTIEVHRAITSAEIPDASWASCDAVIVWHVMEIPAALAERLARCRIIVRSGIGYDRIDVVACARHGIPVCNVPTYDITDVVNSTIAMTLALMRGLLSYHEALKADLRAGWRWEGPPVLRRVRGQRFAVIGCGRIGTAVSLRARALGMRVGYFDPYLPPGHELSLDLRRFHRLEDALAWADAVSLHTPLNQETANMIDARAVAAMKSGILLVNCARGGLVDLDALEAGIRSGRIAGAALDAFPLEPPAPHPLLTAWAKDEDWIRGRLCITPHSSWYSRATLDDIRRDAATTVADRLATGTLRNCVNRNFLEAG